MMVATSPPPFNWPRCAQLEATSAMIWSPSITLPFSSADDHPVGITIQCNADVGAQFAHLLAHHFRMG